MWYALVVFIPRKNMTVVVTSNDGHIVRAESAAWAVVQASADQFNIEGDSARRKFSHEIETTSDCHASSATKG
jgi:hypothetical protein